MLSVLIPTYNYDVTNLVTTIHKQLIKSGVIFEIIVFDDASKNVQTIKQNKYINTLQNCSYQVLPNNIGRSKLRNLLAKTAQYKWLLFLDADVIPKHDNFIDTYLIFISKKNTVTYGGLAYKKEQSNHLLRYKMGVNREAFSEKHRKNNINASVHFSNTIVPKSIFNAIQFDENLSQYGQEDTLFHYQLIVNNLPILHINNPVYHLGLCSNKIFITKMRSSITNLYFLEKNHKLPNNFTGVQKAYQKLSALKLLHLFYWSSNFLMTFVLFNLHSKHPSLFLFDVFKLNYFCKLKLKNA